MVWFVVPLVIVMGFAIVMAFRKVAKQVPPGIEQAASADSSDT